MKIVKMTAFNEMSIQEEPIPELKEGEALIKVKYVGVCGSDVHIFEGKHPTAKPPMVLGHEFYGELADIKSTKVTGFSIGDRVSGHPLNSCGYCEHCMSGHENLCKNVSIYGVHKDGCYAEYVKIKAERLVKLNKEADPEVTALLEPLAVAVHDIRRSGLQAGEDIFIIGAGTIGLMLAVMAEYNGAGKIILTDVDEKRIAFGREMGYTVLNALDPDYDAKVSALSGGKGFKRVFEVSGTQAGWDNMTKACGSGGTIVLIGIPNQGFKVDVVSVVLREIELKGVRIHPYNHFRAAAEILNQGKINNKLKKLVSRVYPVENVSQAFKDIHNDKTIVKALIQFS